ncbi:MauE/DoxX family redox-associated membrane protein [Microbispora sp. CA-135349]|uniref:MauE/DoxX family redox-associated membrane protein n=1 Tax=Microbispora sp. CA-135349 TaxID=3239953 RepID=UPI003D8FCAAD
MTYLLLACRMTVGLTFLVSLASKLRGREPWSRFADATARLLPGRTRALRAERRHGLAATVAVAVAAAEAAVVVLTAVPATASAGFAVALAALAAFSFVIRTAIRRGLAVPCHCFGGRRLPVGPADLARNAVLGSIALTGLALTVLVPARGPAELAGAAVAALAALLVTVLVVLTGEIADLFGLTRESR